MSKLFSRKFIVTLLTLLGFSIESSSDPTHMIVMAVVSCAYVVAQALVDRSQIVEVQKTAAHAIAKAQSLLPMTLILALSLPAFACSGVDRFVETTAPIVDPLLRVIGYCQEHAPKDRVDELIETYKSGDKMAATLQAAAILQDLKDAGVDVPQDRYSDLVMTMASIEGLQRGLRALDGRDTDGHKLPVPPDPVPEE